MIIRQKGKEEKPGEESEMKKPENQEEAEDGVVLWYRNGQRRRNFQTKKCLIVLNFFKQVIGNFYERIFIGLPEEEEAYMGSEFFGR